MHSWQRASPAAIPFFAFPPAVRRAIYTTDAIENLQVQRRTIINTRGPFPNDDANLNLLWLALRNVLAGKVRSAKEWEDPINQFASLYGER